MCGIYRFFIALKRMKNYFSYGDHTNTPKGVRAGCAGKRIGPEAPWACAAEA